MKHAHHLVVVLAVAFGAIALVPPCLAAGPPWKYLWFYAPCNFQVDKNVDDLIALMRRARQAGYNGMLTSDHKFGRLHADRPPNYFVNLGRVRQAAADLGLEVIPCVMDVGYSNSILQNNPNLAEGIAVADCPMRVQGGKATVANPANLLAAGGFEEANGDRPAGWDFIDTCVTRDTAVKHSGAAAARMEKFLREAHGNGRVVKKLALAPWRQYRVDAWIKTQGLAGGEVNVAVLTPAGRSLNFTGLGVKPTQDWTEHHVLINTLDSAEASVYVGVWGGREGTLWLDDVSVREVAGVNLLRREGCPVKVTSEDSRTVYEEGRDFQEWKYPKMGMVPWPGGYEAVHPEPALALAAGSRIKDGETLKVSFYHTVVIYSDQVSACLRHDEVFQWMRQEVRLLKQYLAPKKYFMSHDELRVAGQCGLCKSADVTAGQVLARNVKQCTAIIRQADPEAEIFVWSDMFDPNHNAVDQYYLVGSTLKGSWEGLDPLVHVMAWYFERRDKSLPFFAERGHKTMMAGYYDTDNVKANVEGWREAVAKVQGVEGIMYTTWRGNYKDLEEFARLATAPRR